MDCGPFINYLSIHLHFHFILERIYGVVISLRKVQGQPYQKCQVFRNWRPWNNHPCNCTQLKLNSDRLAFHMKVSRAGVIYECHQLAEGHAMVANAVCSICGYSCCPYHLTLYIFMRKLLCHSLSFVLGKKKNNRGCTFPRGAYALMEWIRQ